jgi:hypothetical protein
MGWCNFSINIDEIEVIQGLQNKKRTYGANNIIKSGIGRNILTYHGKIFLQPNNALSDTYTEVVSRRQFKWNMKNDRYYFYSTDKAIITNLHRTLEYFEMSDDKEIIKFFDGRRKTINNIIKYYPGKELLLQILELLGNKYKVKISEQDLIANLDIRLIPKDIKDLFNFIKI